jgi:hypothetical protein
MEIARHLAPAPSPAAAAPAPPADPHRFVVGFSTPKRWNFLSWAIRRITGSKASHAWLLVDDPVFRLRMVMESHTTGFRLVPLTEFAKTNEVVALAVPQVDLSDGVAEAGAWLGSRYDFTGLLGMCVVLAGRWLHQKWKNPVQSARSMFCSEAVVRVLQAARYPHADAIDPDDTSPQDLLALLQGDGSCEVVDGRSLKL